MPATLNGEDSTQDYRTLDKQENVKSNNKRKLGRTDFQDFRNVLNDNVRPTLSKSDSAIVTTDVVDQIIKINVGEKSHDILTKMPNNKKKISDRRFWSSFGFNFDFVLGYKNNENSLTRKIYKYKNLNQVKRFCVWRMVKEKIFFERSKFRCDHGTDYIVKRSPDSGVDQFKQVFGSSNFRKLPNFKFPIPDAIVKEIAQKISAETYSMTLPSTILKLISMNHALKELLLNKFVVYKAIEEFSVIQNVEMNFIDAKNASMSISQAMLPNDGIESLTIYVDPSRVVATAALIQLLCMTSVPYLVTDVTYQKTLNLSNFDFFKSNGLKRLNIVLYDNLDFNAVLKNITSSWWTIKENVMLVEEIYKEYLPSRYSSYHADGLIYDSQIIAAFNGESIGEDEGVRNMPLMCLPSFIGILQIIEPQTFGLSVQSVDLSEFLYASILKLMNLENLVTLMQIWLVRSNQNIIDANDYIQTRSFADFCNHMQIAFEGISTSDDLYDQFYSTGRSYSFEIFSPGILKKLYLKYYPVSEANFYKKSFSSNLNVNIISFSVQNVLEKFKLTSLFKNGIELGVAKRLDNVLIVPHDGRDVSINILERVSNNLSGLVLIIEATNEENSYYFSESDLIAHLMRFSNVKIDLKVVKIDQDFLSGLSLENSTGSKINTNTESLSRVSPNIIYRPFGFSEKKEPDNLIDIKKFIKKLGFLRLDPRIVTNLATNLNVIGVKLAGIVYNLDMNFKDRTLTVMADGFPPLLFKELYDELSSVGITSVLINLPANVFSGSSSKPSGIPKDEDFEGYDDEETRDPVGNRELFDDSLNLNKKSKGNLDIFDNTRKFNHGVHRLKEQRWKNVDIRRDFPWLGNILGSISDRAVNKKQYEYTTWTDDNVCAYDTLCEIVKRQKLKLGSRYKYAIEDLNFLRPRKEKVCMGLISGFMKKYGISVFHFCFHSKTGYYDLTHLGSERPPVEIIGYFPNENHVTCFSETAYIEIADLLELREHFRFTSPKEKAWRDITRMIYKDNDTLYACLKKLSYPLQAKKEKKIL